MCTNERRLVAVHAGRSAVSARQQCGARAEDGHGGGRVYQPEIRHAHLSAQIPGDLSPLNTPWIQDGWFFFLLIYLFYFF